MKHRLERQAPATNCKSKASNFDDLDMRLRRGMAQYLKQHAQRVERKQHQLQLNSPVKRLGEQKLHLQRSEQKLLDAMEDTAHHSPPASDGCREVRDR